MSLLENIMVTLLGAIIGALLSFALPYLASRRRNAAHKELVGTWKSIYVIEDSGEWITEELTIELKGANFYLSNGANPVGDMYTASASLNNWELTGHWKSNNGFAGGSLLLAVRPQGSLLYGYYTGLRANNERVFAAWVIGRDDDHLRLGRELIRSQTLALTQNASTKRKPR